MLGFKQFTHASVTIGGIELAQQIKKKQLQINGLDTVQTSAAGFWEAVLAA